MLLNELKRYFQDTHPFVLVSPVFWAFLFEFGCCLSLATSNKAPRCCLLDCFLAANKHVSDLLLWPEIRTCFGKNLLIKAMVQSDRRFANSHFCRFARQDSYRQQFAITISVRSPHHQTESTETKYKQSNEKGKVAARKNVLFCVFSFFRSRADESLAPTGKPLPPIRHRAPQGCSAVFCKVDIGNLAPGWLYLINNRTTSPLPRIGFLYQQHGGV